MGNKVLGIPILIGVLHIEKAYLRPRRKMEVRYNVLRIIFLYVAELIVESTDRAQMPTSVVVRVDTWLETVTEQRQDGGNAQPRPNPHGAAAAEPPKRN